MLIPKSNNYTPGFRHRTWARTLAVGPLSLRFVVVALLAAAALFYLAQTTSGATRNYKIQDLQEQVVQLKDENQRLQIEAVRLKSLNEIRESTKDLNLQPIN